VSKYDAKLSARKLLFTYGGPLPSAMVVKGVWRESAIDDDYYWSVPDGEPGYYFCRKGASQDEAPGGAFGYEIYEGIYDNSEPPFELTEKRLASVDGKLKRHGLKDARLYIFSNYD
jgi:hypothetical protein